MYICALYRDSVNQIIQKQCQSSWRYEEIAWFYWMPKLYKNSLFYWTFCLLHPYFYPSCLPTVSNWYLNITMAQPGIACSSLSYSQIGECKILLAWPWYGKFKDALTLENGSIPSKWAWSGNFTSWFVFEGMLQFFFYRSKLLTTRLLKQGYAYQKLSVQ